MDSQENSNHANESELEEGEILDEDDDQMQLDKFILNDDDIIPSSSTIADAKHEENHGIKTLFDRSRIENVRGGADFQSLDLPNVSVYDANKLAENFIDQATNALNTVSSGKKTEGKAVIAKLIQETDASVKLGEMTPFEMIIKRQEELANTAKQRKKQDPIPRIQIHYKQKQIDFSRRKRIETKLKADKEESDESEEYDASEMSDNYSEEEECEKKPTTSSKRRTALHTVRITKDDGNTEHFLQRIKLYKLEQEKAKIAGQSFDDPDQFQELKDEFHISNFCWDKLYKYQKTGVRWLYELHNQYVGGILADEMGLGKTIQICVFLHSLTESQKKSRIFKYKGLGPSLIVCPATVLHQWVKELNSWFPLCKVAVLHSTGAHSGSKSGLIRKMSAYRKEGSILIISYSTYMLQYKKILDVNWHYVILDEGHKIRNPDAKVTLTLKELRTPHRIILSGSPLQNNLKELWSLIDFVYPGRLGSLHEFVDKFSIPITQGGYANATTIQVRTAYKCALILREAINPYLLRRMKRDVQMVIQLPEKTEQILFCEITSEQRRIYEEYIESKTCREILAGSQMPFAALMFLRKLCNHPDLVTGGPNKFGDLDVRNQPELEYGAYQRSGKMIVVQTLLKLWFEQGQKVLFFSQSRQMLAIIESVIILAGYKYLRMDGTTPIGRRQDLVAAFNNDKSIFIFLLTTKVGGLGINLTGANRVIIYDPDWNPSTDVQARERAWRIGQNRAVTIYRLLTSGTIEEKIYQRQIFKHFLANRVLVNPKQQRFFKTNDLHELFTLGSSKGNKGTETADIFASTDGDKNISARNEEKSKKERSSANANSLDDSLKKLDEVEDESVSELSEETKERLQRLARKFASNFNKLPKETSMSIESDVRKSKKLKGKSKSALFDGKYEVPMLKKQKPIQKSDDLETAKEKSAISKEQDDYVLSKLFQTKSGGIHSALRHDQIVTNGSVADIQLIEDEANAVAKRAANMLKRSRRAHQLFVENTSEFSALAPKMPKNSMFGRKRAIEFMEMDGLSEDGKKQNVENEQQDNEPEKHFDGSHLLGMNDNQNVPAGVDLLTAIRRRKERHLDVMGEQDETDEEIQDYPSIAAQRLLPLSFGDQHEKLAEEVRNFLAVNNGRASTNEILTRFKKEIQPTDAYVFRSILKNLCKLKPNSEWLLKEEYL